MPSSFTASLRFEKQFTGENINLWGDKLNTVLDHVDYANAGFLTKALTADYTLTTSNASDDEARASSIKFTGTGPFTVTIPSLSKHYVFWNACTAAITVTTGTGSTVVLVDDEIVHAMCDGTNVKRVIPRDFGATKITNLGDPTNPQDAATKAYADALAFTANAGVLPGQTGAAGKFLTSDGATALWGNLKTTRDGTTNKTQLLNNIDTVLGGIKSDTSGNIGFVNASGSDRLVVATSGRITTTSDGGTSNTIPTTGEAIAFAIAFQG